MLAERLYVTRPIALRNPIVFYEGHLPGFSVNTLIKKGLGRPGVDARLEEVFARGFRSLGMTTLTIRNTGELHHRSELSAAGFTTRRSG